MGSLTEHIHVWRSLLERAGFTLADIPVTSRREHTHVAESAKRLRLDTNTLPGATNWQGIVFVAEQVMPPRSGSGRELDGPSARIARVHPRMARCRW
jgi:hypothetical protein